MKLLITVVSVIMITATIVPAQENIDSTGLRSLSLESFEAVKAFFKYDRTIPLDGRILEQYETRTYVRNKIVFNGVRGDRVSGYLAIPKTGGQPFPLVLMFHVGAGSKESWWDLMSFERGLAFTDSLITHGVAVLALDAQYHGERSMNNDYLSIQQMYFDNKWLYRYRDGIVQTIGDYLRAVDYLEEWRDIDVRRIGLIGHSIGGVMSCLFAAIDQRVKVVVASVAAYTDAWLFPVTPINVAGGIHAPTLVLGGRTDNIISVDATRLLFSSLGAEIKEIEFYDSGHRLPAENIGKSVQWLNKYLENNR